MRTISKLALVIVILTFGMTWRAHGQFIPTVYDRIYGETHLYDNASVFSNGDVVITGKSGDKAVLTWIGRDGVVSFSKIITDGFSQINRIENKGDNAVMIVGTGEVQDRKSAGKTVLGRAIIIDNKGNILQNYTIGDPGTVLTCGKELRNGDFIFGGYRLDNGARKGLIVKINSRGKQLYQYVPTDGAECFDFEIMGSTIEYIIAAFNGAEGGFASVVRLDELGKPFYITPIKYDGFKIESMASTSDGGLLIAGGNPKAGGQLLKLRPEGDIVFSKPIVPASEGATLNHLYVSREGNILVGGSGGGYGYYALLRNDGTELSSNVLQGSIESMGVQEQTGDAIIAGYNTGNRAGMVIKLSSAGKQLYANTLSGSYDRIKINPLGEVLLADAKFGRLTMLSNYGEVMLDRPIRDDKPQNFAKVYLSDNGDIVFTDARSRVVKLAHGLLISDVKINKPVNGFTTALFTVTLTGYATTKEGAPLPVVINYQTQEGSAKTGRNFDPMNGSLSFVPANDGTNRYMVKQTVEVPIRANNYVEGRKQFEMLLGNVAQSYIIKPAGECLIEDQQALLKFIGSRDGYENGEDLVMEVGLFKSNGTPLVNDTGADIMISGSYGKGTADASNFDMGRTPRLVIADKQSTGNFHVKTLENTRYEIPKTVVLDFNNINSLSDANVSFETSQLTCTGRIIDQPAVVAITSLGDHGRRNNNVSGFFKISLLRASDGALLTNATGSDIEILCEIDSSSSAAQGSDFVLTNQHDLRIWGDGNRSAVNMEGVVLYSPDNTPRTTKVNITGVKSPDGAPQITVSPTAGSASFQIK